MRLLSDPHLPEKIEAMNASEIMGMIEKVGLEDSGEIVAFASSKQLEHLFDLDLWKAQKAGSDEIFDPARFGVWLEVLLELGPRKAGDKLSEMDEDFLVLAISSLAWVADSSWLQEGCEIDPRLDKVIDSSLSYELENYVLFSRDHGAWDALITILADLDTHHFSTLSPILDRCAGLLMDQAGDENEGLYDLLTTEDQLIEDVAHEREKRREAEGFVSPANARAFLKLCEAPSFPPDRLTPPQLLRKPGAPSAVAPKNPLIPAIPVEANRFQKVFEIFRKYPEEFPLFSEQLGYLANVLMSGWNWNGRSPHAAKAMEIVLDVCERDLSQHPFTSFPESFRRAWTSWRG